MDLGPHAVFIVMAYAVTGLIVAGLIVRAALDHRAQLSALASLEARGARRRSDPGLLAVAGENPRQDAMG